MEKILQIVSGHELVNSLTALTMAQAILIKTIVRKDLIEDFVEVYSKALKKSIINAEVSVMKIKMKENG